jgi:hypothetical protein
LMAGFIDPDAKTGHGLRAHTMAPEKRKIKVSNRLIDSKFLPLTIIIPSNNNICVLHALSTVNKSYNKGEKLQKIKPF